MYSTVKQLIKVIILLQCHLPYVKAGDNILHQFLAGRSHHVEVAHKITMLHSPVNYDSICIHRAPCNRARLIRCTIIDILIIQYSLYRLVHS